MVRHRLVEARKKVVRWVYGRQAGVALIIALSAPLLLAATGLTVDAGLWMERQASLQSAADAAALAAANAAIKYNVTSDTASSFATGTGENFAVAAANQATQSQFSLASSGSNKVTLSVGTVASGTSTTLKWTAAATIPRGQFFSIIRGLGMMGLPAGNQSASGTAATVQKSASTCAFFNGIMSVTGGGYIKATNCATYNGDSACPSTYVDGSGKIMASDGVLTTANCVATNGGSQTTSTTRGSGYIGTDTSGTIDNGDTSTATLNAPSETDPVAGMNGLNAALWNPGWTAPSAPTEPTPAVTPSLGYNKWNSPGVGDCVNLGGSYSAQCELYPGYFTGMSSVGVASLLMNEGTSNGQTYVTGSLKVQANSTYLTLNGNNYYFDSGASFTPATTFSVGAGTSTTDCNGATTFLCFVVNGGLTTTNGTASYASGIYYLTGKSSGSNVTGWAMSTNTPTITIGGGTYYVNGGFLLSNGTNQTTMGSGLYEFVAYNGNTSAGCTNAGNCGSKGAFAAANSATTFGNATSAATHSSAGSCASAVPSTYYFDGGLTMSGGTNYVTMCPGIYYIRNGNFLVGSGVHLTGTGVTIVLEGTAGYDFTGGAFINLSAPTSNCVDPASYPDSAYENISPYDGTNGEGICGIAIYQARGDSTGDQVVQGAGSTINGAIYTPSAPLTISGAGSLTIVTNDTSTTQLPGIEATSLTDSGSGNITITENSASGGPGGGATSSTTPVLVN